MGRWQIKRIQGKTPPKGKRAPIPACSKLRAKRRLSQVGCAGRKVPVEIKEMAEGNARYWHVPREVKSISPRKLGNVYVGRKRNKQINLGCNTGQKRDSDRGGNFSPYGIVHGKKCWRTAGIGQVYGGSLAKEAGMIKKRKKLSLRLKPRSPVDARGGKGVNDTLRTKKRQGLNFKIANVWHVRVWGYMRPKGCRFQGK